MVLCPKPGHPRSGGAPAKRRGTREAGRDRVPCPRGKRVAWTELPVPRFSVVLDLVQPLLRQGKQLIDDDRILPAQVFRFAGIFIEVGEEQGVVAGQAISGGGAPLGQEAVFHQLPVPAAHGQLAAGGEFPRDGS